MVLLHLAAVPGDFRVRTGEDWTDGRWWVMCRAPGLVPAGSEGEGCTAEAQLLLFSPGPAV